MLLKLKAQTSSSVCSAKVFCSYSHKDEDLKEGLLDHLSILKREGFISVWHDRKIGPGQEWSKQIKNHLESADLILLLISASFIASDYCYDVEMGRALELHAAGKALVVPIILKPVVWQIAPFANLQALPWDGKPVTSWRDKDKAFAQIAEGLRSVLAGWGSQPPPPPPPVTSTVYWVLRVADEQEISAARAEGIVSTLSKLAHDPTITLQAMLLTAESQGPPFEADFVLSGSEKGMRLVAELNQKDGLSTYLDCAVIALEQTYGATVLGSATITSAEPDEDFDLVVLPSRVSAPVQLTGFVVDHEHPTNLRFLIDSGTSDLVGSDLAREQRKVINYFWAATTIDDEDLWVNLSAYESNRMIAPVLEGTQFGRDLLEYDCMLKRFTASLMHPDREPGATYWEAVHAKVYNLVGTNEISISSFQKVWMIPGKAAVYEKPAGEDDVAISGDGGRLVDIFKDCAVSKEDAAMMIAESDVRVLCESDLFALAGLKGRAEKERETQISGLCLDLFRELLLPLIEKEVNECENFRAIQQMYRSLILARAFRDEFSAHPVVKKAIATGPSVINKIIYNSDYPGPEMGQQLSEALRFMEMLAKSYSSQGNPVAAQALRKERTRIENNVASAYNPPAPWFAVKDNTEAYAKYMRLFREGVFRCSRRQLDPSSQKMVTRTYLSGAIDFRRPAEWLDLRR